MPLEHEELHLIQGLSPQSVHGGADVPQLHEPLPKAAQRRVIPQGHGFIQVPELLSKLLPRPPAIGAQSPLLLPAQGAERLKLIQHERKADILLLFDGQFHWLSSKTSITGTVTLLAISC